MSVATTGPVAQLGLKQNVTSLITTHQFGGETASSYISLPQAHPQAHTESCLSSLLLFLQKPPRLCSSCPRFSIFMYVLCTYLQECIHRALLPVALNLNHSLMPQQTRWKHCHVPRCQGSITDPLVAVADEEGRQVEDIGESVQSRISSFDSFSEGLLFLQLYSSSNFPLLSKWKK